jgi:hypothetical protein
VDGCVSGARAPGARAHWRTRRARSPLAPHIHPVVVCGLDVVCVTGMYLHRFMLHPWVRTVSRSDEVRREYFYFMGLDAVKRDVYNKPSPALVKFAFTSWQSRTADPEEPTILRIIIDG